MSELEQVAQAVMGESREAFRPGKTKSSLWANKMSCVGGWENRTRAAHLSAHRVGKELLRGKSAGAC